MPTTAVMWFRRDLRLADNPALLDACDAGHSGGVLPLFVLDPALWGPAGVSRRWYLAQSLRALDASLRQRRAGLSVVRGDPVRQVLLAAQEVGASRVHVAADYGPYGHQRDLDVEQALAEHDIELVRTGSPYAVAPDRVKNGSGDPYKVYTPFSKGWMEHGWRDPVEAPTDVSWLTLDRTVDLPDPQLPERPRAARGRGEGSGEAVAGLRRRAAERLRRHPGPPRPRRHQPHVGAPEVGRDPPAHDAGRPQGPHRQGRGDLPQGARLAGVLRRRALPAAPHRPGVPPSRVREDAVRRPRATSSTPGARAAPASPSWTPGCGSCGPPAGCTTGSG